MLSPHKRVGLNDHLLCPKQEPKVTKVMFFFRVFWKKKVPGSKVRVFFCFCLNSSHLSFFKNPYVVYANP